MATESHRGVHWSDEKTEILIKIWSDHQIQTQLRGSTRNITVFERISKELLEHHNIQRTAIQCREKIKKLRQAFTKVEDANRKSGNSRRSCPFYDLLAPVLRDSPIVNPPTLLSSRRSDTPSLTQDSPDADLSQDADLTQGDDLSQDDDQQGDDQFQNDNLQAVAGRLARGTAVRQAPDPQPSTSAGEATRQPGPSATPGQSQSRRSKKPPQKRKAASFDLQDTFDSFQKFQETALKQFNDAERERMNAQMAMEERRERRESKRDKQMMMFFAQMSGGVNSRPNFGDSDSSEDEPISRVLGNTSRVLFDQ